ncbi:MAG: amidohydrolase family protein [Dehalococcoidia bacterium]|nr:amidohydrolase family protein [Dehalococcoidia bacterium]
MKTTKEIPIIDAVCGLFTHDAQPYRPEWRDKFLVEKIGADKERVSGHSLDELVGKLDDAGIEKAIIHAVRAGQEHHPSSVRIPYELVHEATKKYPGKLYGVAGIDPTEGMEGVRKFEWAIKDLGFVGAHFYPHWFEIPPNHAKVYPFYAKCVELGVPIQMQVGQSLLYDPSFPRRSVGQPITLDEVACDFPELILIGIHVGIPWTNEMIAMAWKHPNVYIGSDAHSPKYWPKELVHYINTYGKEKVIFGTDFPVLDFDRTIKEIEELDINKVALKKLMYENTEKIYKLK